MKAIQMRLPRMKRTLAASPYLSESRCDSAYSSSVRRKSPANVA